MRLRHIPGAEQMIEENPHVVHGAKEKKGTWQQIFGNDHPIKGDPQERTDGTVQYLFLM